MNVSVLGLGAMGGGFAAHLAADGHAVNVWNRTTSVATAHAATHGTVAKATPREALAGTDVVVMVRDDVASRWVWLDPEGGIAQSLPTGALALECSTLSRSWVTELTEALPSSVRFVEAPVVGSRPQLAARQLVSLVGGPAEAVAAADEVLKTWSARIEHVGPHGAGAEMKLVVNALFAAQAALFGEVLGAIESSSLDSAMAAALLASLPVTSPAMQRAIGLMSNRQFSPNFPIELVAKDLGYATDLWPSMPMTSAARRVFDAAVAAGHGEDDIVGVVRPYFDAS